MNTGNGSGYVNARQSTAIKNAVSYVGDGRREGNASQVTAKGESRYSDLGDRRGDDYACQTVATCESPVFDARDGR